MARRASTRLQPIRSNAPRLALDHAVMGKAVESRLIRGAFKALLRANPDVIDGSRDWIDALALAIGYPKSTVATWLSPVAGQRIPFEAARRLARALDESGANDAATAFLADMIGGRP